MTSPIWETRSMICALEVVVSRSCLKSGTEFSRVILRGVEEEECEVLRRDVTSRPERGVMGSRVRFPFALRSTVFHVSKKF